MEVLEGLPWTLIAAQHSVLVALDLKQVHPRETPGNFVPELALKMPQLSTKKGHEIRIPRQPSSSPYQLEHSR